MPANKRIRHIETKKLMALAFNDAVRDILHCDGTFHLSDSSRKDAVWQWDGHRWDRIPLVEPDGQHHSEDDAPVIEVEHDVEMASLG